MLFGFVVVSIFSLFDIRHRLSLAVVISVSSVSSSRCRLAFIGASVSFSFRYRRRFGLVRFGILIVGRSAYLGSLAIFLCVFVIPRPSCIENSSEGVCSAL